MFVSYWVRYKRDFYLISLWNQFFLRLWFEVELALSLLLKSFLFILLLKLQYISLTLIFTFLKNAFTSLKISNLITSLHNDAISLSFMFLIFVFVFTITACSQHFHKSESPDDGCFLFLKKKRSFED